MATIGDLGEFGFIERITPLLPSRPGVLVGAGDDCAVLQCGDRTLLVTCDLSIENIHFRLDAGNAEDVGWKAIAASLSDIAAMGGTPLFATVSLAAPRQTDLALLDALYRGMAQAAQSAGAAIVGGDTTASPEGLILDSMVIGEATEGRYLLRRGALPGDKLIVTGFLGRSRAGLHAQEHNHPAPELLAAHRRPLPRLREGQWLARRPEVHAMIDVSDGLVQDAAHIAALSSVGLDIVSKSVPIAPELRTYCAQHGLDPVETALAGGEDYELAFAADFEYADALVRAFNAEMPCRVAIVGEFSSGHCGVRVDGQPSPISGFDHFKTG